MPVNWEETYQRLGNLNSLLDWLRSSELDGKVHVQALRGAIRNGEFDVSKDKIEEATNQRLGDLNFLLDWLRGFGLDGKVNVEALCNIIIRGDYDVSKAEIE